MEGILNTIKNFINSMGFNYIFGPESYGDFEVLNWRFEDIWMGWQYLVMYAIAFALIYLAIAKKFEPLLLLPIAIGMLLTNLPGANLFNLDMWIAADETVHLTVLDSVKMAINQGGFLDLLYIGVKLGIYPCIIFIGIGAMTDFTPLIANPKYFLIGAGAQFGVFVAFSAAILSGVYTIGQAASIGIIGGADGPTAILVTKTLGPAILGAVAIAAYSYMALIPMIQPPFMKLLTTKKERLIKMEKLRPVSRIEKLVFPVLVTFVVGILVPDALSLVGCLMFGNILNVCGVTERLSKTVQNEFMNIITILLGISVGATASAKNFLSVQTVVIIVCGLVAFCISTCGGLITAKIMNWLSGGKINPLIGSAGVSAVPMAARVAQTAGQKEDPSNFLLMHAMGPNVAGVIGSAVAAGVFLSWIG
ncbi:MAG: sodium ion-translocating decarboxylase subunit beta [Ruminococcaceae bacterium]|nr:sodium ion-translocating decarboxylase subunit beta [Oscillospiraceae bacterium]